MASDRAEAPPPYTAVGVSSQQPPGPGFQKSEGKIAVISLPPPDYDDVHCPEASSTNVLPVHSQTFEDHSCFSDGAVRRGFVRKVYLTLMIQLLITTGIICVFLYWKALNKWTLSTSWFPYTVLSATAVFMILLSCCRNLRRMVPLNFIFLGLFTVAEGLTLGSLSVYFDATAVMWAVGATAFVALSLSVFAMQSKWDFTTLHGTLWAVGWSLVAFGLLCAILQSQYLNILYSWLGTLLFSIYLVVDTQLILGGKHRYTISPEEYIFAALSLYLDVVLLFLFFLSR